MFNLASLHSLNPFDGCSRWQSLLTRRADGKIAATQWGLLQDHLASCPRCRAAAQADDALHSAFSLREPTFAADTARAFDDRILAALSLAPRPQPLSARLPFARLWTRFRTSAALCRPAFSFDLLAQVGGGAVVAAGLTSLFLLSALHSGARHTALSGVREDRQARQSLQRSALPVALEALLDTPSPCAAMLWTTPKHTPHSHVYDASRFDSAPLSHPTPLLNASPERARPVPSVTPARPAGEQHSAPAAREAFG